MRVENGFLPLVPVRSDKPIPKDKLNETLELIAKTKIRVPVKMGDKLIENVLGMEINYIISRDLVEML